MNLAEELLLWGGEGGSGEVTDADAADAKLTGNAIKRGDCQSDRSGSTVGCPFGMVSEGGRKGTLVLLLLSLLPSVQRLLCCHARARRALRRP